jgi:putative tryptophan/tyrosine transport system ATP-binding protein
MNSIDNIAVTFGAGTPNETRALAGLSVSIQAGQFVTVIGSNGSGKSTLLNAIAGEIPVERGTILIDDVDVTRSPPHRRARLVARVFQDPMAGTCDSLTVEQNMALAARRPQPRRLRPAFSETDRKRFHLALIRLGLENRLGDLIGLLSGGQRQAISLIMATLAPSRILLLDEHTAALDPKASENVLGLTKRIVGETGLTTMMVTHSMRDALSYGDRLIMLHHGKVILDVHGDEKARLTIPDVLDLFGRIEGEAVEDRMLLS